MTTDRRLGLVSTTTLVVASMVGTGVFTTSGFLLRDLGSPMLVLLVWGLGGGLALLGAASYGALARRIPESGGEYLFLSRTVHPAAGYMAGWVSLLVGFSAPLAAAAYAFGAYTYPWLPFVPPKFIGTVLVLAFTTIHSTHVERGARVQDIAVVAKVFLLAVFCAAAFIRLEPVPVHVATRAEMGTVAVSLVWVSFSYSGWNAAVYIGGEVRDPERTLPRSLLLGTAIVTGLYVALNAVFVFAAPVNALAGQVDVARVAAHALGGAPFANAITFLIALALVTSISSMVMAGPRVYAQMAADGYMPRWLATRRGPPRRAILLQAAIALVMLWSATFDSLLTYIGFTLGLSTVATIVGLWFLRAREGADRVPVPGWPWAPAVFCSATLLITLFTMARRPVESAGGIATLFVGFGVWWWLYGRRR